MGISYHPAGAGGGGATSTSHDAEILCDDNGAFILRSVDDGAGGVVASPFLLDGTTPYVPVGTVKHCAEFDNAYIPHCDLQSEVALAFVVIEDAEETIDGAVTINGPDLEIGHASGEDTYIIGMRFTAALIPQGANIKRASIQFTADGDSSGDTFFRIFGEGSELSPAFLAVPFDLSNRPYARCQVAWTPDDWFDGDAGSAQETTDISTIVQEIIDHPDWVAGNTIGIHIRGERGKRQADSFVHASVNNRPRLIIRYDTTQPYYTELDGDGNVVGDFYTDPADGAWKAYTPTGIPQTGECADRGCRECDDFIPTPPDEDINIDFDDAEPDLVRLTAGATHVKALSNVQGVTVTVTNADALNTVDITTKSGTTSVDYAPISFTWNAPDDLENVLDITANGTSVAYVHWTEI